MLGGRVRRCPAAAGGITGWSAQRVAYVLLQRALKPSRNNPPPRPALASAAPEGDARVAAGWGAPLFMLTEGGQDAAAPRPHEAAASLGEQLLRWCSRFCAGTLFPPSAPPPPTELTNAVRTTCIAVEITLGAMPPSKELAALQAQFAAVFKEHGSPALFAPSSATPAAGPASATVCSLPPSPGPTQPSSARRCSNPACCQIEAAQSAFRVCGSCRRAAYCTPECQRAHWKSGHKAECRA